MPTLTPTDAADLFRRDPDGFLDVGEGEVAHRRIGSGPDVLFVHGFPVSGATFRTLLPHLVDHVTCHVIDLPGAGSSRFDRSTEIAVARHVENVRRVIDLLQVDEIAVVGHDSGGLIARHAVAGDPRLRAMGLIDTEPAEPSWRFRAFLWARHLPRVGAGLGWIAGRRRLRRNGFVFGDAFVDRDLLDGEFDELFLQPLRRSSDRQWAAERLLKSFDFDDLRRLPEIHARIDVPVQLVWGVHDEFFPIGSARVMANEFPDAELAEIADAGLFAHEERPAAVAAALLPVLIGSR